MAEILRIFDGEGGSRIESALRHGSIHTRDGVEPRDDEVAAGQILVVALLRVFFRALDGRVGDDLSQQGRAQAGLGEFHHGIAHVLVPGDDVADADAALGVPLGHGINDDHVLFDAFQVHGGDIRLVRIAELAIDLVGEEVQIVFLNDVAESVELFLRIEIARGVVRVADEDGPGLGGDDLLERLDVRKGEVVLDAGGDGEHVETGLCGEGQVVRVAGFHHDDLVARVHAGHEGHQQGFGAAGGDEHVFGRDLDSETAVVSYKFLAERQIAVAGAVFKRGAVDVFQRIQGLLRSGEIRLADVEMIYFDAVPFGGVSIGYQLSDGGSRHSNPSC